MLAKYAAQVQDAGIRVILVGLGGNIPVPIPVYDAQTGQMTGSLQKDGATVTTQADEASMNDLQAKTNAEFERILPGQKTNIHWASTIAGAHSEARGRCLRISSRCGHGDFRPALPARYLLGTPP